MQFALDSALFHFQDGIDVFLIWNIRVLDVAGSNPFYLIKKEVRLYFNMQYSNFIETHQLHWF